jgi:ribonuclease VapC
VIVDSSALVAVLVQEPGHEWIEEKIGTAARAAVGAPTAAETAIVMTARTGLPGRSTVARFLHEAGIVTVPFGDDHWRTAGEAFARYGKGRHPARLNLGDCLTYAVARLAAQPLLCVGDDFAQTDLELVT